MDGRLTLRRLVFAGLMGGIMVMGQVLMRGLPNIEPVSLLVIMYTLYDKKLARAAIALFILMQGILYGFGLWWFTYLYIWYTLHFLTLATRKMAGPVFCALLAGAFGLAFGTLTSIPYFISGGLGGGLAYIIAGVPFDLLHCAGNFLMALLLYKPLRKMFDTLEKHYPAQQA